ncbi:NAD(P)H nitroreductase [Paraferrimonas sedimenticola]|uniref:Putative NAD(P)H nitroreductase n=1 Tax=Paraferrimonas sedimenticola TaxID=375674 RepID=A0AA37RW89_9GAMM|nr:NAD(P)H nitroreductase [Paraferrimonas sedimenticola]GLP96439.1 NAD(P)H nitroreductase [Paraferrimonas sedimenticola]
MQALELLTKRQSCPRLIAPGPSPEQLQVMLDAAARTPDHMNLMPWEFVVIEGLGLQRLSDIFVEVAKANNSDEEGIAKSAKMPTRAPMIIAVISRITEHPKVPAWEQHISAGCAVHAIQMAAVAQGLAGIWRTGSYAEHPVVREAFDITGDDKLVGFLYLGTPATEQRFKPSRDIQAKVRYL